MKRGIYLVLVLFVIVTITGVALAVKPENPGNPGNDPLTALWNAVNALQDAVSGLQANDTAQETKIQDALEELSNFKFQHATHQLDNPVKLRFARKDVARLKTVLREYELGIRKSK